MAFTVWLVSEGEFHPEECEDGDVYEFLTGGVLAVHHVSPGRWSDYYPRTCGHMSPPHPTTSPGNLPIRT